MSTYTTTITQANGFLKELPLGSRRARFLASHQRPDRDSQVILLSGLDTTNYMRNPILLVQHNWSSKAVGRVEDLHIATVDEYPALLGTAFFPDRPASNEAYDDVLAGLYNSVSVGLLIRQQGSPIMQNQLGVTIVKSELIEISLVSVPACSTCLISQKDFQMKNACNCTDIEITDAQLRRIPEVVDHVVREALHGTTSRRDELEITDADYEYAMRRLPAIIREALNEAIAQEVRTVTRRLQRQG